MMQKSSFRSPWSPSHPILHGQISPSNPNPPPSSKPKVVSIPVHFVESAAEAKKPKKEPDSSAVEIQRHVRGFLVRKKVEAVRKMEREVDEIEKRIEAGTDLIRREEKERIRVNEMLMAVLLRLDSVRGVREYRRKVIRRAISLQEKVDSLSAEKSCAETLETMEDQETQEILDSGLEEEIKTESFVDEPVKSEETLEEEIKTGTFLEEIPVKEIVVDEKACPMEEDGWSIVEDPNMVGYVPMSVELEKEKMHCELVSFSKSVEPEKEKTRGEEDFLGLKSVMERMVEENAAMKGLVTELCERSALQCRLMGGLAKRVERPEKTVLAMERKKKKKKKKKKREATGALVSENKSCHRKSGEQ